MYLLLFLIPIILIHEASHAIVAKWCGCKVETLALGFGKAIWQKKYKGTLYRINWIILGGYCGLKHELSYSRSKSAFTNMTYTKKVLISLAGIIVNVVLGVISTYIGFYFGNEGFYYFGIYSIALGLTNLLPLPALDGFYPIVFLFEKLWGKRKTYRIWTNICGTSFTILMILNILSIPLLIYWIYIGRII